MNALRLVVSWRCNGCGTSRGIFDTFDTAGGGTWMVQGLQTCPGCDVEDPGVVTVLLLQGRLNP